MNRVYVLAEGLTEQAFVRDVLTRHLSANDTYPSPVLLGPPGHKGGIRGFSTVQKEISNLLKQDTEAHVTTLFDRYGLPGAWPGLESSKLKPTLAKAHSTICQAMHKSICAIMGQDFRPKRFLPYVQFYELEAFLFVSPEATARLLGNSAFAKHLQKILQERGECENINDDPANAPSKRIEALFPNYKKGKGINADLPRICTEVGLQPLRDACPLLNRWVEELESLAGD